MLEGIATAVVTLGIVIGIIYLSFVFTKQLSKHHVGQVKSRYMKVYDKITVGQDRSAAVVQVGDRYFLIGVTAHQVNLIAELEEEGLIPLPEESPDFPNGSDYFKTMMKKLEEKRKKR